MVGITVIIDAIAAAFVVVAAIDITGAVKADRRPQRGNRTGVITAVAVLQIREGVDTLAMAGDFAVSTVNIGMHRDIDVGVEISVIDHVEGRVFAGVHPDRWSIVKDTISIDAPRPGVTGGRLVACHLVELLVVV